MRMHFAEAHKKYRIEILSADSKTIHAFQKIDSYFATNVMALIYAFPDMSSAR